jgi:multidrug efflux pump subunit AcrB
VALADEKTFAHKGTMDFVDNRIDAATGTMRGREVFENENLQLTPGMGREPIAATRVWLDPDRLSAYGMTAGDVVSAIREQNVQLSGGALGQLPAPVNNAQQITITTQGRFQDVREFRNVIVKAGKEGRLVHLRDVARIELGAHDYVTNSYLDGKPAAALAIFQRPMITITTSATASKIV